LNLDLIIRNGDTVLRNPEDIGARSGKLLRGPLAAE